MDAEKATDLQRAMLPLVDILVAAYWKALKIDPKRADDPARDRLVFSKGHAATVALKGLLACKDPRAFKANVGISAFRANVAPWGL